MSTTPIAGLFSAVWRSLRWPPPAVHGGAVLCRCRRLPCFAFIGVYIRQLHTWYAHHTTLYVRVVGDTRSTLERARARLKTHINTAAVCSSHHRFTHTPSSLPAPLFLLSPHSSSGRPIAPASRPPRSVTMSRPSSSSPASSSPASICNNSSGSREAKESFTVGPPWLLLARVLRLEAIALRSWSSLSPFCLGGARAPPIVCWASSPPSWLSLSLSLSLFLRSSRLRRAPSLSRYLVSRAWHLAPLALSSKEEMINRHFVGVPLVSNIPFDGPPRSRHACTSRPHCQCTSV